MTSHICALALQIEPIMEERKHLNIQIQANLPHDTFHTKNALTYIKVTGDWQLADGM